MHRVRPVDVLKEYKAEFFNLYAEYLGAVAVLRDADRVEGLLYRLHAEARDKVMQVREGEPWGKDTHWDWYCIAIRLLCLTERLQDDLYRHPDDNAFLEVWGRAYVLTQRAADITWKMGGPNVCLS